MAFPVYSTRFVNAVLHSAASAVAARYTVPPGKVAVVRSIDFGTPQVGDCYFAHFKAGETLWWFNTTGLAAGATRHWDGDHVFTSGEVFGPFYSSGLHIVTASGFLLNQLQ